MPRQHVAVAGVLVLGSVLATPADAQSVRLLGEGSATAISAAISSSAGHDRSTVRTETPLGVRDRSGIGNSAGASGSASVASTIGRTRITAAGSTDFRYYASLGALSGITGHSSAGSLQFARPLGQRSSFRVLQSFSASSFYQYNPFAGVGVAVENDPTLASADYRLERGRTYSHDLRASADVQTGRYTTLTFDYTMRTAWFPVEELTYRAHGAGGRLTRRLTPGLSLVAGYGYDRGAASEQAADPGYHRIDLGVSYGAALPFSRRTAVTLTTGAAMNGGPDGDRGFRGSIPRLTAVASLRHPLSRQWSTGLEYRREPQLVDLFRRPTYGDTVAGSLRGSLGRRVGVTVAGGYARSTFDASPVSRVNETIYGSARTSISLGRTIRTYAEYGYYQFDMAPGGAALQVSNRVGRHAARAGLSWAVWPPPRTTTP